MNADPDDVVQAQIRYYSERAPEYDETAIPPGEDPLAPQGFELEAALAAFAPRGRVLEIACGTGGWTRLLAAHASDVTALDASAEMLELCRRKVKDARVRFVEADVFRWEPETQYDVVFFANWLSHVPPKRFKEFWSIVERCLAAKGRVFFVDEETLGVWRCEEFLDEAQTLVRRRLRDGRFFDIVKVFYDAPDLERRLRVLGWDVTVNSTGDFYWGQGTGPEEAVGI